MVIRGSWLVRGLALGTMMLVVTGCTPTAPTEPSASPTPTFASDYATPAPVVFAPLTGLAVDAPESLARPSLAAKVDNHPGARPQVGLETTDIVFEELVEGGMTRYVAVWHSNLPAEIGPVRSIRPMDPDIVSPLGGMIAYSGGQERFVAMMRNTEVYNAIHGQRDADPYMFRSSAKKAPHNVLVKAQELVAQHTDIAAPRQQFSFAESADASTAARDGEASQGVDLRFGGAAHPSWRWDAAASGWVRAQDGAPDVDGTGAQLRAANVVVLRVPISTGMGVPKTELVGSGEAWVLSAGRMVHATWSKADRSALIRLVDGTGAVVRLAPGNSWVELLPTAGDFTPIAAPAP